MKIKTLARLTIARATPARLMGLRIIMRERCQGSTAAGGVLSVSMVDLSDLGFFCFFDGRCSGFSGTLPDRGFVESVLFAVVMQRHFAIPPRPIHRINIRVE